MHVVHGRHDASGVSVPCAPYLQSMGQLCVLQLRVSAECGHALPPWSGSTIVRWRDWNPPSQEFVHVAQGAQSCTSQSSGHSCSLQSRVSAECAHALPPWSGAVKVRERFWLPLPHDFVQVE